MFSQFTPVGRIRQPSATESAAKPATAPEAFCHLVPTSKGLAQCPQKVLRFFKTSQSTVASWIRRNKVPEEVIAKAIDEKKLTLEDLLSSDDYVYIRKVDLAEIIKRMSEEKDLRRLKPSEIISLYQKCSSGK